MATVKYPNVRRIYVGYDSAIAIKYPSEAWSGYQLETGQIVAQFRASVEGPVLWEADTEDGTITRPGTPSTDRTLQINIPASVTEDFPLPAVLFDFIRINGGVETVVDGIWQWPVMKSVTRDV